MRRSIRNLLGLATVTAAVAVGIPATATAAGAFAAHSSSSAANYRWGTYRSGNRLAKANGVIDVRYIGKKSNRVRVTGKVWDLDHRTHRPGGKCAYVPFRFQKADRPHRWSRDITSFRQCGAPGPSRSPSPGTTWRRSRSGSARSPATAGTRPVAIAGVSCTTPTARDTRDRGSALADR